MSPLTKLETAFSETSDVYVNVGVDAAAYYARNKGQSALSDVTHVEWSPVGSAIAELRWMWFEREMR